MTSMQLKLINNYLAHANHHMAEEAKAFPLTPVAGNWRVNQGNNDCGIYVMYFMEKFKGEVELTDSHIRKVWFLNPCFLLPLSIFSLGLSLF
jgi:hypothetical protein